MIIYIGLVPCARVSESLLESSSSGLTEMHHVFEVPVYRLGSSDAALQCHCGKPRFEKSEKIISINKALDMGVTTDKVGAWGGMKGNVIKS